MLCLEALQLKPSWGRAEFSFSNARSTEVAVQTRQRSEPDRTLERTAQHFICGGTGYTGRGLKMYLLGPSRELGTKAETHLSSPADVESLD